MTSKGHLHELITALTQEQQHSVYERTFQREDDQAGYRERKKTEQCDIAIVGLGGRYPRADNHYDFWHKLQKGTNFIEEVPASRWDHSQYYDRNAGKDFIPHKTRCKFGAFLDAPDQFDAPFFNIHLDEAFSIDPQVRIALETTWTCIEDAGYVPAMLGKEVGVFSGVTYNEYQKLIPISTHSFMLNNRIAYFFDFQGPTVTTDAGCCSSLTAIHLACRSLIAKECKAAIVIGANIILHPDHYSSSSSILSPTMDPYSKPFGTQDGWIPAEGVVSVLLKPLEQAIQDHDNIYAVIKSTHICQEGKTAWFSAFSPKQQARLIHDNFKKSGIHPETISYVEAAANGSLFGDAIEIEGLSSAFGQFTDKKQFCPIGTVKSHVGHAEGVSTLFQLTKVLLQFKSRKFIPLINVQEINPNIKIENTPFYFQTESEGWESPTLKLNEKQFALPRRATISSFGAGGNIGHLILEEHVAHTREKQVLDSYFIPLSSKTAEQLRRTVKNYITFFERYRAMDSEWESRYTLLNIMFNLCAGRVQFKERVVFIADSLEMLIEKLYLFLKQESDPDIISNPPAAPVENNQAVRVQKYLKNRSWNELAQLWVRGLDISWESFFNSFPVQRISLPTYCFEKRSFPVPKPAGPGSVKNDYRREMNSVQSRVIEDHDKPLNGDNSIIGKDISLKDYLVVILSKLLGITAEELNINRSLDQYGFDSILFVSLFQQLQSEVDPTLSMTALQECRTTQDIMNIVRPQTGGRPIQSKQRQSTISAPTAWPQFPELINLNQKYQGRPVFWFHAVIGGVEAYQSIARKCKRPFYGIQARGWMTDRFPLQGIQAMSSYYVHIIRSVQPEGPYDLGGFSLGGTIAYEVTRQLQELGQVVDTMVMLDAPDGHSIRKVNPGPKSLMLQAVNIALVSSLKQEPEKIPKTLIHRRQVNSRRDEEEFLRQLISLARERGITKTESQLSNQIRQNIKVRTAYQTENYSVLPLLHPDAVTCWYFRNKSGFMMGQAAPFFSVRGDSASLKDHTKYWDEWMRELPNFQIIDVDSTSHMTMLSEPRSYEYIGDVCEKLYPEGSNARKDLTGVGVAFADKEEAENNKRTVSEGAKQGGGVMARISAFMYGVISYYVFLGSSFYTMGFLGNLFVPKSIDSGTAPPFAYALFINSLLLGLFAVQHSVMARSWFKAWWTKIIPGPMERSTYVLLSSLLLFLLFWQWKPMPEIVWNVENSLGRVIIPALYWTGWLLMTLISYMIDHFEFFGLRQVYEYLRNKPSPEKGFRTPALYKYVRHPLMLAYIIILWATPKMTAGHLLFALALTGYILFALPFEERDLVSVYGDTYRKYKQQVPMLFPLPGKRNRHVVP